MEGNTEEAKRRWEEGVSLSRAAGFEEGTREGLKKTMQLNKRLAGNA